MLISHQPIFVSSAQFGTAIVRTASMACILKRWMTNTINLASVNGQWRVLNLIRLCLLLAFSFMLQAAQAQSVVATLATGGGPTAITVNPITNKTYVVNQNSAGPNTVTVLDQANNTTTTVAVGSRAAAIAVNTVTNKIYVVNSNSNNVTVIDGADNSTQTITSTGTFPMAVAVNPVTNRIYVVNQNSNNVTVIDGLRNAVRTVAVGFFPSAIAVNPVTNQIYVTNFNSSTVSVIDGASNNVHSTITVNANPGAIALNPVTNKIYVGNVNHGSVSVIDGASNTATTVAVGAIPEALAVNPATNKVYVANRNGNSVTVINGADNTTATVGVGGNPFALAISLVTNKIYVLNLASNNVSVIDGASNSTVTLAVGNLPLAVAINPVTSSVYVANSGDSTVSVISDKQTTPSVSTVNTKSQPFDVAINSETNKIYVTNFGANSVTVIDGDSNTTETVAVGGKPGKIAINKVTNKIYVVNQGDISQPGNTVTVIDGISRSTTSVRVGLFPFGVAVNPVTNKIYVTSSSDNTVTVIDGTNNSTSVITGLRGANTVAVNPLTNKIYVTDGLFTTSSEVSVIDGATNAVLKVAMPNSFRPNLILVDTATNKIYFTAASVSGNSNVVIDGATNLPTTFPKEGSEQNGIALNPVTNRIYVLGANTVSVLDSATSNLVGRITILRRMTAISVDVTTNKIYVVGIDGFTNSVSSVVSIIDGVTGTISEVAAGGEPFAMAVNSLTNKVYVANSSGSNVTVISPTTALTSPPLTTTTSLTGAIPGLPIATANTSPTFTFALTSRYSPNTPAIRAVYYQLGSTTGVWQQARTSGVSFEATLPTLAIGDYTLYAFAIDALEGGATGSSNGFGTGNSPLAGSVAASQFSIVSRLAQAITGFVLPASAGVGGTPIVLSAMGGSSGNPVVFSTSSAATICVLSGANNNTLSFTGVGVCSITANQVGDVNYAAAPAVNASITVSRGVQVISGFTPPQVAFVGDAPIVLTAVGGPTGNAVVFSTTSAPAICTLSGSNNNTVAIVGAGTCSIIASQAGDTNYLAASPVIANIIITTINRTAQVITGFAPPATATVGGAPIVLTATGGASGNPVVFTTISPGTVCTLSGVNNNTVTLVGAGVCSITANQAGNASFLAATTVTADITISNATPTVALTAVVSRKTHGTAGTFDLPIDLTQAITGLVSIEPRIIGTGHRIVFQFNGAVTSVGNVSIVDGAGNPVTSFTTSASGNEVVVTITALPDVTRITVSVAGVNNGVSASASMGFLVGDVNSTRGVNVNDILVVRLRSGELLNTTNFLSDINTTGGINVNDILIVRLSSGNALP
jgi:YVTN family beta-propeller protein